ncbi:F-box/FBD/LRR-repeat protein At1g16930-like [Glycine soja]|uniref:F-box/FBD/LRR-repeat protein At1g16930-like n=1 Tax=Glycine soja TaxID=3848 RepID=UPI00103F7796|nr:F-box/FBD/LRR-repeat protein At1g16930-like [Glycine soja]
MLHITTKGRETNLFAEKKKTTLARLAEKKQVHGEEKKKQKLIGAPSISLFLPTHEAIATSLLSKRWKPLWHSVPAFDLDDEPFLQNDKPYSSFLTFAYVAILSRNPSHSITHFHLNSSVCRNQNDLLHFNIWLNAIVVQLDVKHLQIEAPRNHSLALLQILSSIFNYKTLVVLKLCRLFVDSNSVESVHLPELKTPPLDDARMLETRYLPHCRGFAKRLRF